MNIQEKIRRCLGSQVSEKETPKNPEYRDVMYIENLVSPDTVNTAKETGVHWDLKVPEGARVGCFGPSLDSR